MKIVAISGSPTKGGNTEYVVDFALNIAKRRGLDVEKIALSELEIGYCVACYRCIGTNMCKTHEDDMQFVYDVLREADGIIFASPVMFGGVTGQLRTMMDRLRVLKKNNMQLKNKIGAAMVVYERGHEGQELVLQDIQSFMLSQGMIVIGGQGEFGGIVKKPAEEDEDGLLTVEKTVNRMCDLLEVLQ
ncbi:flavodoxin family protein [Candidatus Woesearchaeota archaeon]|nr:MAG: flavodoxin family protein [Candidatus Woesearchaeota archaeon]